MAMRTAYAENHTYSPIYYPPFDPALVQDILAAYAEHQRLWAARDAL